MGQLLVQRTWISVFITSLVLMLTYADCFPLLALPFAHNQALSVVGACPISIPAGTGCNDLLAGPDLKGEWPSHHN
jgi:hypothetical protein